MDMEHFRKDLFCRISSSNMMKLYAVLLSRVVCCGGKEETGTTWKHFVSSQNNMILPVISIPNDRCSENCWERAWGPQYFPLVSPYWKNTKLKDDCSHFHGLAHPFRFIASIPRSLDDSSDVVLLRLKLYYWQLAHSPLWQIYWQGALICKFHYCKVYVLNWIT